MLIELNKNSSSRWRLSAALRSLLWMLLIAGTVVIAMLREGRTPKIVLSSPAERRASPDFALPLLHGGVWQLQQHRGHVVLVNFWATWCQPCRRELPTLSTMARDDGPLGLDVVGMVQDAEDRRVNAENFLRSESVSYPIAVPEQTPQPGGVSTVVPTTVLIDRKGRVAAVLEGSFEESSLRQAVTDLLREP